MNKTTLFQTILSHNSKTTTGETIHLNVENEVPMVTICKGTETINVEMKNVFISLYNNYVTFSYIIPGKEDISDDFFINY